MEIEFDEAKSDRNLAERGFDFSYAARIFDGLVVESVDRRRDYGEIRMKAIGEVAGEAPVVVYTDRGAVRRIISARLASRRERTSWRSFA